VLSHPLLLLIVGALLTSLLIPNFTRRWQDHQRQLDLQDQLTSTISRSATKYILAVQRARNDPSYDERPALETWGVESVVIDSRLHAYYPPNTEPDVAGQWWESFEDAAAALYRLATAKSAKTRTRSRVRIRRDLHNMESWWYPDEPSGPAPTTFRDTVAWMQVGLIYVVRIIGEHPPKV
jgi:hypothetical protein